eukprot:CAMPEP_0117601720 /NCGR_PEP_ID=MMETSP0784-20121206/77189_1 /TAXON_ID=39447 /ORGANISM="" /LENGTH=446 /DNA_ID=CAMNT_0005404473 /DNA_START=11 /DNA_END=1350 /DNA_ORIENTATION=+
MSRKSARSIKGKRSNIADYARVGRLGLDDTLSKREGEFGLTDDSPACEEPGRDKGSFISPGTNCDESPAPAPPAPATPMPRPLVVMIAGCAATATAGLGTGAFRLTCVGATWAAALCGTGTAGMERTAGIGTAILPKLPAAAGRWVSSLGLVATGAVGIGVADTDAPAAQGPATREENAALGLMAEALAYGRMSASRAGGPLDGAACTSDRVDRHCRTRPSANHSVAGQGHLHRRDAALAQAAHGSLHQRAGHGVHLHGVASLTLVGRVHRVRHHVAGAGGEAPGESRRSYGQPARSACKSPLVLELTLEQLALGDAPLYSSDKAERRSLSSCNCFWHQDACSLLWPRTGGSSTSQLKRCAARSSSSMFRQEETGVAVAELGPRPIEPIASDVVLCELPKAVTEPDEEPPDPDCGKGSSRPPPGVWSRGNALGAAAVRAGRRQALR